MSRINNMRKTRRNRTLKKDRKNGIQTFYAELVHDSKAGIRYIKHLLKVPSAPLGLNHKARRVMNARNKKA